VLVVGAVTAVLSLREARITERMLDISAHAQQLLHVALSALPTLRASGATERLAERWANALARRTREAVNCANLRLDREVAIQTGRQVMAWATSAGLAWQALAGDASLGTLMLATMLVGQVLQRLLDALRGLASWVELAPHRTRVDALLAELGDERAAPATKLRNPQVAIEVSGLCFRFERDQRWILQDYSLRVAPGQHMVLSGASGSGKSTLLRLISGLASPERGRVEVFGVDPFTEPGLVAYVPQQASLLEASIANNLTVLSGASLESALAIAQSTGLAHMLSRLPMGHQTLVAAGGSNLSAGQRQLNLLTAAFASDKPVLLLDEVTSQLDAETRAAIRWDVLEQGRTIISVRHE
jgi:ABC-type bacteriocin/lantibiotic exporter with double-glycine peptidase domain